LNRFRAVSPGAAVEISLCNHGPGQQWILNSTDETLRNKHDGQCLIETPELEVWSSPLHDGSQAVLLLNRGNSISEPITVQWTDIGFPPRDSALVRDLWAKQPIGPFRFNYTSPNIDPHSVLMLKITLYQ